MISARPSISFKDIVDNVCDIDIYRLLGIDDDDIGRMMISPLRGDDSRPSFIIRPSSGGRLLWKDFGTSEYGDSIELYKRLNPSLSVADILTDIWRRTPHISRPNRIIKTKQAYPEVKILKRKVQKKDLDFWNSFHIRPQTLELFNVHPISVFWIGNDVYNCENIAYAYDLITEFKIYRPYDQWMRFVSGGDSLQGTHQLPEKGSKLVIQKSYKDVMFLHQYDIPSIAPQAESVMINRQQHEMLSSRFDDIYIWGDVDKAGDLFMTNHVNEYGYKRISNDDGSTKDVTDHAKKFGADSAERMIKRLLV